MNIEELTEPVRAEQVHKTPLLEKIVAFLGLGIVVLMLTLISLEAKDFDDRPPELIIKELRTDKIEGGYLVRIEAINKGSRAAADLVIEGELGEGPDKESSQVTFDYVPARSKRDGGLFFRQNPEGLKLRPLGYQSP